MQRYVRIQPSEDIWIFISGLVKVNVSGMSTRALVQPSEDMWLEFEGMFFRMLPEEDILMFFQWLRENHDVSIVNRNEVEFTTAWNRHDELGCGVQSRCFALTTAHSSW